MVGVICKLSCESKYLANVIKDANDEIGVYGAEISILKEFPKENQPSVPVQFIVVEGVDEDTKSKIVLDFSAGGLSFLDGETLSFEQIGAVLYVRGK